MGWKARLEHSYGEDFLRVWDNRPDGSIEIVTGLERTLVEAGELSLPGSAAFVLPQDREMLQAIVDEAARQGIRPADEIGPDRDALRGHLRDMRAIVAHNLGIKLD